MKGLAVYLNPDDPTIIHKVMKTKLEGQNFMNSVISQYYDEMNGVKRSGPSNIHYILQPFSLDI